MDPGDKTNVFTSSLSLSAWRRLTRVVSEWVGRLVRGVVGGLASITRRPCTIPEADGQTQTPPTPREPPSRPRVCERWQCSPIELVTFIYHLQCETAITKALKETSFCNCTGTLNLDLSNALEIRWKITLPQDFSSPSSVSVLRTWNQKVTLCRLENSIKILNQMWQTWEHRNPIQCRDTGSVEIMRHLIYSGS